MIYRVLGELEIHGLSDLPGGPTLIVLAALLVNVNRRVSKAELIRAAWGSYGMNEAQLQKRIMEVRNLLARIGRRQDLITHSGFGYELRAAEDEVDLLVFQRRVRDAEEAGAHNRPDDEIARLREALELWRGPHPLSNVPGEAFRQDTAALERRLRRAAVRLFDLELGRGNQERVLDELIRVCGFYPSDQRLCEQLMLAEYHCGHPRDVADVYERYREALGEETGGDPDPLLRSFHFAVAQGDLDQIAAAEAAIVRRAGGPVLSAPPVPLQLPPPAELVGRDHMAAEAAWLLSRTSRAAAPVVIISGPGGIGKTALALRAAHESAVHYPDGQLYLELHGTVGHAASTAEILAQVLRSLGAARVPETTAERLAEYRTMLARRRVLIVLDDAADGAQVNDLVPANPRCAVLVTARLRLPEVSGAHHMAALEPLRPVDAAEVFLRVVQGGGIPPEHDLEAVSRVVELCGGLPLALRIAGALHVHDHPRPLSELVDRLTRLGPEGFAYGELSVARTIGAGLERLDADARRLLLGLGLLPMTEFGLWTAAAVIGGNGGGDGGVALTELTSRFMIETIESQPRYRFHDLTRAYVRHLALRDYPGDPGAVPGQVYQALLTLARRAHRGLYGGDFEVIHSDVPDWDAPAAAAAEVDADQIAWFGKERANIRAAVLDCARLGLTGICWDLAVTANEYYLIGGYFDDWYETHTVALDACRAAGDRRGEGIVLACLYQPALIASRRAASAPIAELRRAVGLLAESGDRHGQAIALRTLGNTLRRQGHLTGSLTLFREALAHYVASGDVLGQWQTLRFIGQIHLDLGQHEKAHRALAKAEDLAGRLGDRRVIAQTRYWIGQACLAEGDIDGAQAAFDTVFDIYGDAAGVARAYALHGVAEVARRRGAYGVAEQQLTEAAALAHETDAVLEGRVWLSVAALRHDHGKPDEEPAALDHAVSLFAGCGAADLEARALAMLAKATAGRDDAAADSAWTRIEALYDAADLPDAERIYRRPVR